MLQIEHTRSCNAFFFFCYVFTILFAGKNRKTSLGTRKLFREQNFSSVLLLVNFHLYIWEQAQNGKTRKFCQEPEKCFENHKNHCSRTKKKYSKNYIRLSAFERMSKLTSTYESLSVGLVKKSL